jgi:protein involved in polysaccharide export with SLBB domain
MNHRAWVITFISILIFTCRAFGQDLRTTVQGEVARPGTYGAQQGDRLSSLIERAGGFTDNAWLRGAALIRKTSGASKEEALHGMVARIQRETPAPPGEEERKREFIATLQSLAPAPRLPVKLAHPRLMKGTGDDLPLEDGDVLLVPSKTGIATVIGSVKSPGAVSLNDAKTDPEAYIRKAGGFTAEADQKHVYLVKADGTAIPLSREWIRWNPKASRWEVSAFQGPGPRVEPGDTIVVPKRPRATWARTSKDLRRLLMEIHVLTGVRVDPP